jgi:tetratricopeptide (TPR) repeat protein
MIDRPEHTGFPDAALLASDRTAFRQWRHERVPALLAAGRQAEAIALLDRLLESPLAGPRDALERAKLLEQAGDARAIVAYVDLVQQAADVSATVFGMARLLQARENERAAALAHNWPCWPRDDRLITLAAQAFMRGGNPDAALDVLDRCGRADIAAQAEVHVRLLNRAGRYEEAAALAKRAGKLGVDSQIVRVERAVALERVEQRHEAVAAFAEVLDHEPDNVRALLRRGELNLMLGNVRLAQDDLAAALRHGPHLNKARVAYARSLKAAGEYGQAAELLVEALEQEPNNEGIRKLAVAGLNQAGLLDEAVALYDTLIQRRSQALPADFSAGIQALWQSFDTVHIPIERLDWAWKLRDAEAWTDRAEWERRAKWGVLADKLFYDWLECRTDRLEETLPLMDDVGSTEHEVRPLLARGRGLIVASAHIGPMFAGPLALELLGYDNVWLASVPSLPTIGFFERLISTADQTEGQVVRRSVRALARGKVLTVAVDGAMSMAAPRITFEGQSITYSSFAARLSFKQRAPSIFAMPRWTEGRVGFHICPMPDPAGASDIDSFLVAWRRAYLGHVREALRDAPENLRLSGGLWRDVR